MTKNDPLQDQQGKSKEPLHQIFFADRTIHGHNLGTQYKTPISYYFADHSFALVISFSPTVHTLADVHNPSQVMNTQV
jgi:hypothetical protein